MAKKSAPVSSADIDITKLSSPRIFLVRMLVFLILCGLVFVVLYKQVWAAFLANPGLNALIGAVLAIGIILAFRQVIRLYPEVSWVNHFRISDPGLAVDRRPTLLAPMAAILSGRSGRMSISQQTMRHLLDSIATRLDEARDISRYMTGLLVFLGLLGTFWGLIETVGSVGKVIEGLKVGGEASAVFDTLKEGLAAPLSGMGISFSSYCLVWPDRSFSAFSIYNRVRRRIASIRIWKTGSPKRCANIPEIRQSPARARPSCIL